MTKETAKEYLPLVQALAEGKTIQQNIAGEWCDDACPTFGTSVKYYRIKPEPRRWVLEKKNGKWQVWDGSDDVSVTKWESTVEVVEVLK